MSTALWLSILSIYVVTTSTEATAVRDASGDGIGFYGVSKTMRSQQPQSLREVVPAAAASERMASKLQPDHQSNSVLTSFANLGAFEKMLVTFFSGDAGSHRASRTDVDDTPQKELLYYLLALVVITTMVTITNYHKGRYVVLKILIYLLSLSTMKLTVKFAFQGFDFNYPKLVTSLHLMCSAIAGFTILVYRVYISKSCATIVVPTSYEFFVGISPSALAFALSLAFNNMALVLCSASFTEIIGATTPIVTIGIVLFMGMPFHLPLVFPACLVAAGCMMSVTGELHFSFWGTLLCFLANVARSTRTAVQQKLLTGETRDKFDPPALLAWTCLVSFVLMAGWSLCTEGLEPIWLLAGGHARAAGLWGALSVGCMNACILNLAVLFVTKDLGAVGQQIVAQIKSIATVMGGMCLLGESFAPIEYAGFACVLVGTGLFSYMQQLQNKKEEASANQPASNGEKDKIVASAKVRKYSATSMESIKKTKQ